MLGVNKNTVLRAMHILRDEGLSSSREAEGSPSLGPRRRARSAQVREPVEFARATAIAEQT